MLSTDEQLEIKNFFEDKIDKEKTNIYDVVSFVFDMCKSSYRKGHGNGYTNGYDEAKEVMRLLLK